MVADNFLQGSCLNSASSVFFFRLLIWFQLLSPFPPGSFYSWSSALPIYSLPCQVWQLLPCSHLWDFFSLSYFSSHARPPPLSPSSVSPFPLPILSSQVIPLNLLCFTLVCFPTRFWSRFLFWYKCSSSPSVILCSSSWSLVIPSCCGTAWAAGSTGLGLGANFCPWHHQGDFCPPAHGLRWIHWASQLVWQ